MNAAVRPRSRAVQRMGALGHGLGVILLLLGSAYLLPIAWSAAVRDDALSSLLMCAAGTSGVGLLLWGATRGLRADLPARDGSLLIVLAGVVLALAASLPFLLLLPELSFADAIFETVSALTTTGSTRLTDLHTLPPGLNLWRHVLQWLGGLGIIVLAVAILPVLGVGGMQLFRGDTPGPMKGSRLAPRAAQTGRYLWSVYTAMTLACMLSLRMVGMGWFDSVCHAMSTVSLGGFSTRDEGIAAFDSPAVEGVMIVFMLLGSVNFATHFLAFRERNLAPYGRDTEAGWVVRTVVFSVLLLGAVIALDQRPPAPLHTFRELAFTVVSVATTAGFRSVESLEWPAFCGLWLMMIGAVVASSGSTGGGIKMVRTLVLVKQTFSELLRMSHPRAVRPLMIGEHVVAPTVIMAVLGFMLLYGVTLLGLTLALVASGMETGAAVQAVVASLNNIGPGLAPLGLSPDPAGLTEVQAWILAFAMMAGRLELLIVFVLATPAFWRR